MADHTNRIVGDARFEVSRHGIQQRAPLRRARQRTPVNHLPRPRVAGRMTAPVPIPSPPSAASAVNAYATVSPCPGRDLDTSCS